MTYEDHLKHYGVLGMKWGKRKARKQDIEVQRRVNEELSKQSSKPRRMSNKELQSRVKRLELEKKYRDLTPKPETGMSIDKVVKTLGTVAAISGSAYTIYSNLDKLSKAAKAAKKVAT